MGCKNFKEESLLCVVIVVLAEIAAGYLSSSCFWFAAAAVASAATAALAMPAANLRKKMEKGRRTPSLFHFHFSSGEALSPVRPSGYPF